MVHTAIVMCICGRLGENIRWYVERERKERKKEKEKGKFFLLERAKKHR